MWKTIALILIVFTAAGLARWKLANLPQPDPEHWSETVRKAIERHDLARAEQILRAEEMKSPDDPDILQTLGSVYLIGGQYERAIRCFEGVHTSDPVRAAAARTKAAHCAMKLFRLGDLRAYLEEALRLEPAQTEARRMLANVEANLLRPQALRRHLATLDGYRKATAEDIALFCSGDRILHDSQENVDHLENCYEADPTDPAIAAALAHNLIRINQRSRAIAILKATLDRTEPPANWRVVLGLAEDAIDRGEFEEASGLLRKLPPDADELPRTWIARGRVRRELGDVEGAVQAFRNAEILDPYDPEPVYALARVFVQSGARDKAAALFERSRRLQQLSMALEDALELEEPELPPRLLEAAALLAELGHLREASLCYQWLLSANLEPQTARERLEALRRAGTSIPPFLRVPSRKDLINSPQDSCSTPAARAPEPHTAPQSIGTPDLTDVASSVGMDFRYRSGDTGNKLLLTSLGGGAAVLDYDLDAWPDILFPQGSDLPPGNAGRHAIDRLFRNDSGRAFSDVTEKTGICCPEYSHGAATGDYNNDGFVDLVVCNFGANALHVNNGDGTFTDATSTAGLLDASWSTSAAFGDFDRDGDHDLYVVNYVDVSFDEMKPCYAVGAELAPCRPLEYPARQDRLWENRGDGHFEDITAESGIEVPDGKGLGIIVADFDGDHWPDIFVGNDTTPNFLFQNRGAEVHALSGIRFREMAPQAGVAVDLHGRPEACMGIACADVDQNGLLDLLVTNFDDETNTLYRNLGDMLFVDDTSLWNLADSSREMLGWGAQFADFNADGWCDLFVGNGHLHDRMMPAQIYTNSKGRRFDEAVFAPGSDVVRARMGRGAALIDWNRDLQMDVAVSDLLNPAALFENRGPAGRRIGLQFVGTQSHRDATGSRAVAETAGGHIGRTFYGGGGYLSANQNLLIIPLEEGESVDRLEVIWPSGRVDQWSDLQADTSYLLIEGGRALPLPSTSQ